MKFAPFKPCTLPKHVRVEILHREFPVKNLYFPCKGLQCAFHFLRLCYHTTSLVHKVKVEGVMAVFVIVN